MNESDLAVLRQHDDLVDGIREALAARFEPMPTIRLTRQQHDMLCDYTRITGPRPLVEVSRLFGRPVEIVEVPGDATVPSFRAAAQEPTT